LNDLSQPEKIEYLLILKEAKKPRKEPEVLYAITRFHQIWFIDHMHLRTLPDGQKIYSLIIVDGMSRMLLSDEVCFSKGFLMFLLFPIGCVMLHNVKKIGNKEDFQ
jgi:hypothetical protein